MKMLAYKSQAYETAVFVAWLILCLVHLGKGRFLNVSAKTPDFNHTCPYRCEDGSEVCVSNKLDICPSGCKHWQFRCGRGQCVSARMWCRGNCLLYEQECEDGTCVRISQSCPCPHYKSFKCRDGMKCLTRSQVCDGIYECYDGSDERNCKRNQRERGEGNLISINEPVLALIIPLVFAGTICMGVIAICKKKARGAGAVQEPSGTRMVPIDSPQAPPSRPALQFAYNFEEPRAKDTLIEAPPSYEEAMSSTYRPKAPDYSELDSNERNGASGGH